MSEEEYQFGLGLRDLSVSKHWRELPRDYSFLNHKTVLILPGSGTRSAKDANGMCKIAESMLNENIKKHLDDDIWELRPGNNRVLYFYFKNDTFVLLHQFRKKTQKTPKREIERAKAERDDYLARKEAE